MKTSRRRNIKNRINFIREHPASEGNDTVDLDKSRIEKS